MSISAAQQHFHDAEEFEKKGLLQDTIESYKKAIEADAFFTSAYYNLALTYHQVQQPDHAIANLEKVTELDPGDTSAFNNLGVLYAATSRLSDAKRCFEKALSIDGDYQDARNNLENTLQKIQKSGQHTDVQQIIQPHRRNIGFVTLWYERGQAYITKAIRDSLDSEYNTFVFARNGGTTGNPLLQTTGEWNVPNLTVYPEFRIPREALKDWIVKNHLTAVFFNEETDLALVEVTRQCGAKTIGYYVWELFDPQYVPACMLLYDKIICPTKACYEKFKNLGLNNIEYVQWGVDLQVFKPKEHPENKRVIFFHPAGWGGLHARRGTHFVFEAFQKLNDPNTELLIHTQHARHGFDVQESKHVKILFGTVPREEIVQMYQSADIAVLPSKWEGLGLTFLESIGCGLPIITVDAPPMNEFVRDGETGFLCRVAERQNYPGIFVEGVHVDVDDMAEKMRLLVNDKSLRQKMREKTILMGATSWRQEMFRSAIQKIVKGVIPDSIKISTDAAVGKEPFTRAVTDPNERCKLMSKDYAGYSLVRKEDGRQFIRKGDYEEPFVVHLVGARWSNHPWGMENEIHRVFEKYGVTIIDTDFRRDFDRLSDLFLQKAHLMLVVKGNGISPELISKQPCKTVLWYQDDVFSTEHAPKHIAYNGWAFDIVYSFDEIALDRYRELGVKDARYLPLAMSPEVHRKMFLTKKTHDICFVGNVYPNRQALLDRLAKRFNLFVARAFMDDMVKIFNESKIVLNLGVGHTGIQQRVFEAMGCGSFLLTNSVQEKSQLFRDRVHLVYFQEANIEELAEYYLSHDEEREAIALAGYREVNNSHTFLHRIQKILDDVFCREGLSAQTATEIKQTNCGSNAHNASVPTLSVIIPTYNRKHLLQRCIDFLLKNSEQNIEIIVVDDPCSDGTREWLDEIKKKFRNIVVVHNQSHEGASRSVNIGYSAAQGWYLGLITDDIEVTSGWDSPLIALLESNPSYGTATQLILDEDGHIYSMGLIEGVLSRKHPQLGLLPGKRGPFCKGKTPDQVPECKVVREVDYGYHWVMKREVWEKIGGYDEGLGRYCADPDFGMRVRLAGYKNMYCPTSVIIDHGAHSKYTNLESAKVELKKSQILFAKKWDAYVGHTNPISHKNKKYKILIVLAVDTKELKEGIRTAVELLSKQHTVSFVICNDLTAKMDVDVMNHMLVEGVGTFRPDILLILGGKDIYPRMLRKLKKALNLIIMLWWHSEMGNNIDEMPEWAIKLNGETDVCFISGPSLDYVRIAEANGVKRGFGLDSEAHIIDEIFSVLDGDIKDRILLYQDEMKRLLDSRSEQDIVNVSKFLYERGMGIVVVPYLKKVIQNNRNNLDTYLLLSDQLFKQGDMVRAMEILQRALNVPLPLAPVYHRLGKVCLKLEYVNEAEKWLKNSLEQNSHDPEIYNMLGIIFIKKCDFVEAEKWLQSGVNKYPNNIAGLLLLGKLYRTQRRIDESILCFQHCLSIDIDCCYGDEIRNNLEELYSAKKVEYVASNILVSVILFSFNRTEYMARTLYLFSKQTFPRGAFEIIIIDSSNDNTREVIRKAITEYGLNIRYFFIPPPTHGLDPRTSWQNMSVKMARGTVIVWTQPEMLFTERMLEEFYKPHVLEDKLWVSGRIGVVNTKEEQMKIDQVWDKDIAYLFAHHNLGKEMFRLGYKYWVPVLASFKKDDWLRIGGYEENLPIPRHCDLDIFFRMMAIGFSVHNPPGFQGIHQWHVPFEEKGKDILPLSDKTRQIVYGLRRAFLRGEVSAEKYAIRNEGKEIGVVPELKEEFIL